VRRRAGNYQHDTHFKRDVDERNNYPTLKLCGEDMTNLTLSPYRGPQEYSRVRAMLRENVLAARELAILDWCRFIT
jgi:hypothetical protein